MDNEDATNCLPLKYSSFLKELAQNIKHINIKNVKHSSFIDANIEINKFLNLTTIRIIKQEFENYLMYNAIDEFKIAYQKVSNEIHPTTFTDVTGAM